MTSLPVTGGCQCGAVRYALHAVPGNSHFCHCRMCQRAVGGPFAALTGLPRDQVEWTKGEPAYFQSSTVAKRGFCRDCGTPLSFAYDRSDRFSVTLGSLDCPEDFPIVRHYGVESRMPWLKLCDGLPEEETGDVEADPRTAGMVDLQGQAKDGTGRWYSRAIVPVSDVTGALGFYTGQLGFAEDWRHEDDGRLLVAQVGRDGCELILSSQWPGKAGQAMIFISLNLGVLTALRQDLERRGLAVTDGWWGYPLMIVRDPDGNELLFPYPSETESLA